MDDTQKSGWQNWNKNESTETKIKMSNETTYPEIVKSMSSEAKQAALVALTDKFKFFKTVIEDGKKSAVDAVNMAREMGDTIIEFTGHQKLSISEFNQLALALPDSGFGMGFAKECVSIRHLYQEPVTDYAQAKPVFDKLVVQLELLPKGERGDQKRHEKHEIEELLAKVIRCKAELTAATKNNPIAKWSDFYRKTFLTEAKFIHDIYEEALEVVK